MSNKLLVAAAAILPAIFGCAPFQGAAASPLTPSQASLVSETCTGVMGVRPGEYYFANCQETLTQSLLRKMSAQATGDAMETCRAQGLADNSAGFSVCVLNAQNREAARSAAEDRPADLTHVADVIKSGKSYYDVTNEVRFQRERYSCAQLGLVPNTGLFGACIAGLEGAFLADQD